MLKKKDIFIDFSHISSEMRRIFNGFLSDESPMFSLSEKHWTPNIDLYETEQDLVLKMELAGVAIENLQIISDNDVLIIKGTRHNHSTKDVKHCLQLEINYGDFQRRINIPSKYDIDKTQAHLEDGFLIVVIPLKKIVKIPINK